MNRDPASLKRTVTNLSWYPGGSNKVAVAYSFLEFQKAPAGITYESYIWEIGISFHMSVHVTIR